MDVSSDNIRASLLRRYETDMEEEPIGEYLRPLSDEEQTYSYMAKNTLGKSDRSSIFSELFHISIFYQFFHIF